MTNDALIKEARSECAQKYLQSYWFSFSETGSGCIDEILSRIARAGKAYHSTEYWTEAEDGDPSHTDLIQDAAIRAANIIKRLADALTAANAREAALRTELELVNDLRNRASEALEALRKEAAEAIEAIEAAYMEGRTDGLLQLCPSRFEKSQARREAQRIGGAE